MTIICKTLARRFCDRKQVLNRNLCIDASSNSKRFIILHYIYYICTDISQAKIFERRDCYGTVIVVSIGMNKGFDRNIEGRMSISEYSKLVDQHPDSRNIFHRKFALEVNYVLHTQPRR